MTTTHYPSLELCKRLTEEDFPKTEEEIELDFTSNPRFLVMPNIAELLDEMPMYIGKDNCGYELVVYANGPVAYQYNDKDGVLHTLIKFGNVGNQGDIPNNLSEMWLWLKENNYLTK